jgi:hypothetical protein
MHQYRQNSGPSSLDSGRMPEAGSDEEGRNDEPHHRGADRNYRESAEAVGTLSSADSSFTRRARSRAAESSPIRTPGVLMEVIATSIPASSM